jgi:Ca2+-binding EF-hand superfamily protein
MLSADESEATFTAIDTDGDGLITVDEIKALLTATRSKPCSPRWVNR